MNENDFKNRGATFGLEGNDSPIIPVLRLLFSLPRLYQPLLETWNEIHPGSLSIIDGLVKSGFVLKQERIIYNTITSKIDDSTSKPVSRYKLTTSGKKMYNEASYDSRVLKDKFSRLTDEVTPKLLLLLDILNTDSEESKFGISVPFLINKTNLPERTTRWWVNKLFRDGYVLKLNDKFPDTREIIPKHYRVTKKLCNQLSEVIKVYPHNKILGHELKLNRNKFLKNIDPARISITGLTDYNHDIGCQIVLSYILKSNYFLKDNIFNTEPRITLPANINKFPWEFNKDGKGVVFYQPDAEFRETSIGTKIPARTVLEFERFQTRRDSWGHIERFIGWMHTKSHSSETGILRFVVESEQKARAYVELIEAYADYVIDNPVASPLNDIYLAVSTLERLRNSNDPLEQSSWFRVFIPGSELSKPSMHSEKESPYNLYFARGKK